MQKTIMNLDRSFKILTSLPLVILVAVMNLIEQFKVLPPDPDGFDRDGNGIGCEGES
jgi:hypothetical protein